MFTMKTTRLIERCRQGDADALGELYKAYAQRMRGVCRKYIRDKQTVEDVLHDAFVIIFTSFDRLREDGKAESWMMSITRNVASKYKDYLDAHPTVSLEETNVSNLLAQEDEESEVRGIPLVEVTRLIDQLPEGYGKVFRLSVFEGMTHKEIAAEMGIEPHSSSSQLSRAKKMLRKMMQQYWMVLLLLLIPLSILLMKKGNEDIVEKPIAEKPIDEKPIIASQKEDKRDDERTDMTTNQEEKQRQQPAIHKTKPHVAMPEDTKSPQIAHIIDSIALVDTLTNITAEQEQADTTQSIHVPQQMPKHDMAVLIPNNNPTTDKGNVQHWSLELAYAGQYNQQDNYNQPFSYKPAPSAASSDPATSPTIPSNIDNWSDYAIYLANNPDAASQQTRSVIMRIALSNADRPGEDKILRNSHHRMPVTWSLALKYKLNDRWGIETGINYSRLTSDFEMGTNGNTINERQVIHYVGIPVKGIYNLYSGRLWNLYGGAGLTTEIPVYSPMYSNYYVRGNFEASEKTTLHAPWQFSTTFGLGLQYHITPHIGIFAEPSLQYFIPTGSNIETYRTEHSFMFSLPLGLRLTW